MRWIVAAVLLAVTAPSAQSTELYQIVLVQAAPGRLPDLLALYKKWLPAYEAAHEDPPLWFRHSQGDHWDVMLLIPIGSLGDYYQAARVARREKTAGAAGLPDAEFARLFSERVAWHEEMYLEGPSRQEVRTACDGAGLYHVEMMVGLAGRRHEMRRAREQENAYLGALGRPRNLLFARREGAQWDLVTIGCYRDLKHFAESADLPAEKTRDAARAAGYDSPEAMSLAWRSTIATHRDTLGVAIR
jgi:hypothetical protein